MKIARNFRKRNENNAEFVHKRNENKAAFGSEK